MVVVAVAVLLVVVVVSALDDSSGFRGASRLASDWVSVEGKSVGDDNHTTKKKNNCYNK